MRKQLLGKLLFLLFLPLAISCSSHKRGTKDSETPQVVLNDTIETHVWNGKWLTLLSSGFYDSYPVCKEKRYTDACDSIILDVQGSKASLYVLCEPEFNYLGVFKLQDSMRIAYFYMPMDVAKFSDRYRGYNETFLRKYSYLYKHNTITKEKSFGKCPCSLWLSNKLMESKSYRKYSDTLIFVLKDSSEVVFQGY